MEFRQRPHTSPVALPGTVSGGQRDGGPRSLRPLGPQPAVDQAEEFHQAQHPRPLHRLRATDTPPPAVRQRETQPAIRFLVLANSTTS